ncbi:hypothetical protein MUK70_08420 [Dyadobacter chenwenxiniae]|uniref:Uncharacterized protein n=1 Tax=Dyadobacter chenwenxiniae TaxID=2906456 RepID=A0A9X1TFC6_9BACT|nr:hypothetical protein [Dyadobacter chenwenxiniae]MCF0062817.1 hypothetical protein [Dyadobacter chenwenxiniae]UON85008.1 hypothetical protein MUK70_08420 [Dyadobacter chenwenxiniae]
MRFIYQWRILTRREENQTMNPIEPLFSIYSSISMGKCVPLLRNEGI